jgi:hypothetical protein
VPFSERFKLNALAAAGRQTALAGHFYEQREAHGRARTVPTEATAKVSSGLPCICKSTANFDPVASGLREPRAVSVPRHKDAIN